MWMCMFMLKTCKSIETWLLFAKMKSTISNSNFYSAICPLTDIHSKFLSKIINSSYIGADQGPFFRQCIHHVAITTRDPAPHKSVFRPFSFVAPHSQAQPFDAWSETCFSHQPPARPWRVASHLSVSVTSTVKWRNYTNRFHETLEVYQWKVLPDGVICTNEEQQPSLLSYQAGFIPPTSRKPGQKDSLHVEERAPERRSLLLPPETFSVSDLSRLM